LQRGWKPRQDEFRHLGLLEVASPHVALEQRREVAAVLHHERLIEAELPADVFHRLGRGRPTGDLAHRIGGQDIEQNEGSRS